MAMLLFSTVFLKAYAQENHRSIEGLVVDTSGLGLKGVNIRLVGEQDTLKTVTDNNGFYQLKGINGKVVNISYSMFGLQIVNRTYVFKKFVDQIYAPKISMFPQLNLIDEVRILKVIPVINRGDTIQFNMRAFSVPEKAMLEDALKIMPGFQVLRDGTTYFNGRMITSVQVDGRKFFDGNLLMATKNLPADFVKHLEVIDDYGDVSQEKGIKNSEPEKIINIVLEDNKKKITFGQATLGGGTSERYIGSVGVNKFNDGQEISVVTSVNNTNTSLFTFGSPDGAGGRSSGLGDVGDFSDQSDGLNKLSSIGITFSQNLNKYISLSGGYTYQNRQNITEGNSLLTSSYYGYKINKKEDFERKMDDNFHRVQLEINSTLKNQDILKIVPKLSFNRSYNYNLKSSNLSNYRIRERGSYNDTSTTTNPNAEFSMLYSKYFKKSKRKLVADGRISYQSLDKDENIREDYVIYDSTGLEPVINFFEQKQLVDSRNNTSSMKGSVSYVEPFFDHSLLEVLYDIDVTNIEARRAVRNPIGNGGGWVDSLGIDYAYQFKSYKTGLNYQYEPNERFRVNMGFSVQPVSLSGKIKGDTITHEYSNVNLVPTTNLRYRFSKNFEMELNYLGKNIQPNFLHISPVRDNSNSRNIIVGNPSLKAEFYNRFSTSLKKFVTNKGQYFETNFAYTFINNKIVSSKKSLSNETVQETTYENTDGYYDVKWNYYFNTPFLNDNFQMDISGNIDYLNNLSFVNELKSTTRQLLYNQNLILRYNWNEYFESVFNSNYFLNRATYELPYKNKIAAHSFLLSLGGRGYINDKFMVGTEMSQKFYKGYVSEISDVNPTIINAYVEYNFLKNNMAMLRFQCFDMLDQNKNVGIITEYVGNDVFESRNNRLGRYFMLTLNMRLQSYPNKK